MDSWQSPAHTSTSPITVYAILTDSELPFKFPSQTSPHHTVDILATNITPSSYIQSFLRRRQGNLCKKPQNEGQFERIHGSNAQAEMVARDRSISTPQFKVQLHRCVLHQRVLHQLRCLHPKTQTDERQCAVVFPYPVSGHRWCSRSKML